MTKTNDRIKRYLKLRESILMGTDVESHTLVALIDDLLKLIIGIEKGINSAEGVTVMYLIANKVENKELHEQIVGKGEIDMEELMKVLG